MDAKSKTAPRSVFQHFIKSYLILPVACVTVLAICAAVDRIFSVSKIKFPASVTLMMLLFTGLCLSARFLGERWTGKVIRVMDVPLGFALKYINVFFTPSFVMLPMAEKMAGKEVAVVVAVFVIGYVIAFVATVYMVKGIQKLLGKKRRSSRHRFEDEEEEARLSSRRSGEISDFIPLLSSSTTSLQPPSRTFEAIRLRGAGPLCSTLYNPRQLSPIHQYPPTPSSSTFSLTPLSRLLHLFLNNPDITLHLFTLLFVALPLYYSPLSSPLLLHLTLTTTLYHLSLRLPLPKIFHPVLFTSFATLFILFLLSHPTPLKTHLLTYQTGIKYLSLINSPSRRLIPPGAGDIFSSCLDISIISLSLPMYTHRRTLLTHLPSILVPTLTLSFISLLLYPLLTSHLSLSPTHAKTFAFRSSTLALANPATENIGGDKQFVALLSLVSGIFGAVIGEWGFGVLGVGLEEEVVRGVTMGVNSAATGTAWLVNRGEGGAGAVASAGMVIFGVAGVVVTAIPGVGGLVGRLAGG